MKSQIATLQIPAAFFIRPLDKNDPSLFCDDDGYLLPRLISELIHRKIFSAIVLSVPNEIPETIKHIIAEWDIEVHYSSASFPQQRLAELAVERSWSEIVALSSYSYLIDKDALSESIKAVLNRSAAFAFPENVIPNKFFCVLNSRSLKHLASITTHPIPPNHFHSHLLNNMATEKGHAIHGMESIAERFAWQLFFAGSIASIPSDLLSVFFAKTPRNQWFSRVSFKSLLHHAYSPSNGAQNFAWAEEITSSPELQLLGDKIAGQFHWLKSLEKVLPHKSNRHISLEIGFGKFPSTSFFLTTIFKQCIALEPFEKPDVPFAKAFSICSQVYKNAFFLVPNTFRQKSPLGSDNQKRLRIEDKSIEDLTLSPNSIDFCFSRVVLEHVMNVEEVSAELWRVLKSGGVMYHEIGLNDHRFGNGLIIHFDFLRFSRDEWQNIQSNTNLWRINDFVDLWKSMGFQTEIVWRKNTNSRPQEIHHSWSGYNIEDLLCHTAGIRALKPIVR